MKQILSIVAVLALVFALAAPAMAAEAVPSVTADDLTIQITASSEAPSEAEIGAGNKLLGVWDAKLVHKDGSAATADETAAYIASNGGSITVDFTSVVGSVTPVKVLHKIGGTWQSEAFSGAKVTVSSLSPFAFIVKAESQPGGQPGGQPQRSPQTGYNTALWTIAAAAMALCAGYCFVSARKKAAE